MSRSVAVSGRGLAILALIIERSVFPLRLIPDYSFSEIIPIASPFTQPVVVGVALLVALTASAWFLRRRDPLWTFGAVILLVGWIALSNIPIPLPIVFAERLLYGTTAGVALLFAVTIDHLWDRHRQATPWVLLAIVISGNALRTIARDRDWHDELRLFSRATRDAPHSARAWNNLGAAFMQDGRPVDALDALNHAIAIAPDWSPPHTLAGITLADLGRRSDAEVSLRRAYAIDPNDAQAAYNLAVLLGRWGRPAEASAVLRHYVAAHPDAMRERELLANVSTP
jgi:tetratricopeptide (TPR) repeat protein